MVGKALWKSLKEYAGCSDQITILQTNIMGYETIIADHQKALIRLETSISHYKEIETKQRLEVKRYEAEAETLKQRIANKKKALEQPTSKKVIDALEHELAQLKKSQDALEEKLLESWSALEKTTQQITQDTASLPEKKLVLIQAMAVEEEAVVQLKVQINTLLEHRQKLSLTIPPLWLNRFNQMQESVEQPLVRVVNTSCSACYYAIVHQDLAKLKDGGLITCRSCYRFLYIDQESANEEKNQKEISK